ncbi:MAG: TIGR00282 family metallophosphoesterase [Acidobacteria bacterium]|nr:TIGR00282 family metallophosphoesterase [Acidobacteriota bacterium]
MNILFIGDVVGRAGRRITRTHLPLLREDFQVDLAIVNCENAAAGFGITAEIGEELFRAGADVLTSGNHIWDRKESHEFLAREMRMLRPANYPPGVPGHGYWTGMVGNTPTAVLNLQGRVFMSPIDCPFRAFDSLRENELSGARVVFVDFHAEATSEKLAFGSYVDSRASAVVGTHTHVTTADEMVQPGGTAYITDSGMTGAADSIIGMRKESSIERFLLQIPRKFEPAEAGPRLSAVLVEVDEATGRARNIRRICRVQE